VFQAIASKDHQYEWYVATAPGNLARELWAFWLKDAYLPHQPDFLSALTSTKLEQLDRFMQFFAARLTQFPLRFEKLTVDIYRTSVIEYAQRLLDDLLQADEANE